jgi:hypothetical protein
MPINFMPIAPTVGPNQLPGLLGQIANQPKPKKLTGSGTGLGFLSSGGFLDEGEAGGGMFDYSYGTKLSARFLAGEFGPGGYLAPAAQNWLAARDVAGIGAQSRYQYRSALDRFAASGLDPFYAREAAAEIPRQAAYSAFGRMGEAAGQTASDRYAAMQAFINSAAETELASKRDYLNYQIAKDSAKATKKSGFMGMIGSFAGGFLGNPGLL